MVLIPIWSPASMAAFTGEFLYQEGVPEHHENHWNIIDIPFGKWPENFWVGFNLK